MSGKTFNQVEIKPEMISCHLLLYFTQDHQGLASYTTKVLFPTPSKVHSHYYTIIIIIIIILLITIIISFTNYLQSQWIRVFFLSRFTSHHLSKNIDVHPRFRLHCNLPTRLKLSYHLTTTIVSSATTH